MALNQTEILKQHSAIVAKIFLMKQDIDISPCTEDSFETLIALNMTI